MCVRERDKERQRERASERERECEREREGERGRGSVRGRGGGRKGEGETFVTTNAAAMYRGTSVIRNRNPP